MVPGRRTHHRDAVVAEASQELWWRAALVLLSQHVDGGQPRLKRRLLSSSTFALCLGQAGATEAGERLLGHGFRDRLAAVEIGSFWRT